MQIHRNLNLHRLWRRLPGTKAATRTEIAATSDQSPFTKEPPWIGDDVQLFGPLLREFRDLTNDTNNNWRDEKALGGLYNQIQNNETGGPATYNSTNAENAIRFLRSNGHLVNWILYNPTSFVTYLRDDAPSKLPNTHHQWQALAVCVEAIWDLIRSDTQHNPQVMPLAARLRFIVLSTPFRYWKTEPEIHPWTESGIRPDERSRYGALDATFGNVNELINRCQDARTQWRNILDSRHSHPDLSRVSPFAIEQEASALAWRHPNVRVWPISGHWRKELAPLTIRHLSVNGQPESVPAPVDREFSDHVLREYIAPKFAFGAMLRYSLRPWRRGAFLGIALIVGILASLFIATGWRVENHQYIIGPFLVLTYAILGLGIIRYGFTWALVCLLPAAAASAVVITTILGFNKHWWENANYNLETIIAIAALVIVPGFILFTATWTTNNPTKGYRLRAIGRSLAVIVITFSHAWLISSLGVYLLGPSLADTGGQLLEVMTSSDPKRLAILLLASSFCFAFGVIAELASLKFLRSATSQ